MLNMKYRDGSQILKGRNCFINIILRKLYTVQSNSLSTENQTLTFSKIFLYIPYYKIILIPLHRNQNKNKK